jgi:hypothetical protein
MVEAVKLDPTMEEIVVALRETTRGAGRTPPYAVAGQARRGNWSSGAGARGDNRAGADVLDGAGLTDIADLRDSEIDRLLTDNAQLNGRVVYLLRIIEREQACNAALSVAHAAIEAERGALFRDVKTALEAELRPVLLVLLHLLEKQRADPAKEIGRRAGPETARAVKPVAVPVAPDRVDGTDGRIEGDTETPARKTAGAAMAAGPQQPRARQFMVRGTALFMSPGQARYSRTSLACRLRPTGWPA